MTERDSEISLYARTVQSERLRLHRSISATSVIFSAGMGALVAILLLGNVDGSHLLLWLAGLGFALAARVAVWRGHSRANAQLDDSARWLNRYRVCFGAHGLAWSLAGLLFLPSASHDQFDLLSISIFAMSAGSLLATAFDVAAAAAFVLPTISPLLIQFFTRGDQGFVAIGTVMTLLTVSGLMSAWRTQSIVQESVRLRLAEAKSAEEARRHLAQAEAARRELAEKHYLLPLLLRTTQQGFWYINNTGVTIDLNPAMCSLLGRQREDVLGRSVFEFFDADNLQIMRAEIAARQTGKTGGYEIGITRPDGSQVYCFNNATPIHDGSGQRIGSVGLWTDISARQLAEQRLLEATEQLRRKSEDLQLTLDSIDQGIVSVDAGRQIGVYNRRMLELLNLPASLLAGPTSFDDIARFQHARGDFLEDGSFLDVNGQHIPLVDGGLGLPAVYVRRFHSGALVEVRSRKQADGRMVRTYTDVSAYIAALESLRQRESEQRTLLEAFPGYIAVVDEDYIYQSVNERFATLIGIPAAKIAGRHLREVLGDETFARLVPEYAKAAAGQAATLERVYPATPERPQVDLEVQHLAGPANPGGKRLFYVFAMDVTARNRAEAERISLQTQLQESRRLEAIASLEAQLRESQKMEAIGTLAGGIAHDFNNIIATILGNADLARQDSSANAEVLESLEEIRKAGSRARDLVLQILSFSRRQPTTRKPLSLAPLLEESARLLRATLPARVALDIACAPGLPAVLADATQIQQILINLATNAAHAMPDRPGQVTVTLDAIRIDTALAARDPALRSMLAGPGAAAVRLVVRDDGTGMDAQTLARIFEPFFTTKPPGEGTGLGLSVVHGIVAAHEGAIVVDSRIGQGSSFSVYLPAVEGGGLAIGATAQANTRPIDLPVPDLPVPARFGTQAARPVAIIPVAETSASAREHLLYIDDEDALVFLVKRMLERRGKRVSAYTSQGAALEALRSDSADVNLLVSDYNMPGMSGLEVIQAARAIRPGLRVALASGVIDDTLRSKALAAGVSTLIFKADAVEEYCAALEAFLAVPPASEEAE